MPKGLQPEHATVPSASVNAKAAGARGAREHGPAPVNYAARKEAAKEAGQKAAAVTSKKPKKAADADAPKIES